MAAHCLDLLRDAGATVATAESLTAGQISATLALDRRRLRRAPGRPHGVRDDVKISVLGVDPALVARYGAVSTQCAEAMARQALELFHATWALSATGVAGPAEQEGKPAGTVFVGLAGPGRRTRGCVVARRVSQRDPDRHGAGSPDAACSSPRRVVRAARTAGAEANGADGC